MTLFILLNTFKWKWVSTIFFPYQEVLSVFSVLSVNDGWWRFIYRNL